MPTSGRFAGRWRYNRVAGRGIALSYDRSAGAAPGVSHADVHAGARLTGRWRYRRIADRGIVVSYDREALESPPAPEAPPEPRSPLVTHSPLVRVLCSCGDVFTFEGTVSLCPGCGRRAEWPTMSEVERQMRSDLEELFLDHERPSDRD